MFVNWQGIIGITGRVSSEWVAGFETDYLLKAKIKKNTKKIGQARCMSVTYLITEITEKIGDSMISKMPDNKIDGKTGKDMLYALSEKI